MSPETTGRTRPCTSRRRSSLRGITLLIVLLLTIMSGTVHANPPTIIGDSASASHGSIFNISVATIGAIISYDLFVSADSQPTGLVQLWSPGGPNASMGMAVWGTSPFYVLTATHTVSEGLQNGIISPVLYTTVTTSSPTTIVSRNSTAIQSYVTIDNMRPRMSGPMNVTVNGLTWTGGWIKKGDKLRFSQGMDPTAFQSTPVPEKAALDLRMLGGPASFSLTSANPHVSPTGVDFIATNGLDLGLASIGFSAEDPYGNATYSMPIIQLPVDTTPPIVTQVTALPAIAIANQQVVVQVTLSQFDNDTVIGSCTWLSPAPFTLDRSINAVTTFTRTLSVLPSMTIGSAFNGTTTIDITITDKAGNQIATQTTVQINNIMPIMGGQPIASLTQRLPVATDAIGIIGDELSFQATTTFQVGQDGHLYIDLSPIGGPSQVEIPPSATTTQYFLNWKIPSGIAEDTTPYAFNVTARNISAGGNVVASWTTPAVFIDNVPPVIGQKTVTRISGNGGSYKIGDQFKVDVRVSNVLGAELSAVNIDIASLSTLYPGLTRLNRNPVDQTLFEGVFTVGSFTTPGAGWDGLQSIRIIASDAQGNIASDSISTGLPVDNQFIGTPNALYVARPPAGGSPINGYVRAGDWIEFRVTIATAQSDLNPITIDLSPLGLTGARTMVASTAPGLFTYTVNTVPVGSLQKATGTFLISIADNDGNATTVPIDVPLDTALPVISNIQITCPRITKILFNDPVEVTADVTHVLPGNGTVTVNLSRFGLATESLMEYLGGTTWRRAFNASSSTPLDQTSFRFVVTASTTSYLVQATSSAILVDNDPVNILGNPIWSVVPAITLTHPKVRIGDQLTLKVQLATPTKGILDGETATVNLTSVGGPTNQAMVFDGVGTYSHTFIVATGTLNDGATFPFTIVDNDGNTFNSSFSVPLFDNHPPATGPLTVQVTLQVGKQDSTAATVVNLNKYIRMSMGYTPIFPTNDNATATIDLYLIGSGSSVVLATSTGNYSLIATPTIQPVNVESSNYRFTTIVTDLAGNQVAIQSPPYTVDCHPARILVASLTYNGLTNATAPIGSSIVFNVQVEDNEGQLPTVDLSPLNGPREFALQAHPLWPGWFIGTFTVPLGTTQGPASFTVKCLDDVQNVSTFSTNLLNIDQRPIPPTIDNFSITISRTNNDNPISTVSNINDEITVAADIQFWTTRIATLTYVQLATDSGVIIATGTLSPTGVGNRFVATFTVRPAAEWVILNNATLSVYLRAQDVSDNVTTRSASSSFAVDNLAPRFTSVNWWISPNVASVTAADGLPIINVGSGSPIDLLWASATIDTPLYSAMLNLAQVPGAPASYVMRIGGANADLPNGISIASYALIDWTQATFTMTVRDLAGNATSTATCTWIDTRRPMLTEAQFDGATLTLRFDEVITAVNGSEFEILGSTTTGISTGTVLSNCTLSGTSLVFPISAASQTIIAGWASQSLYLKIKNATILPAADMAGNWTYAQVSYPITLTSSLWREDPRIINFLVTQNWTLPNPSLAIDLVFSKAMASNTLVASYGVLFVTTDDFTAINYRNGYVFQPADIAAASWVDNDTRLRVPLVGDAADWMARKLGNGTNALRFAVRAPAAVFCRDKLNKPLQNIAVASPLLATVVRPYTAPPPLAFAVENAVGSAPYLHLGSGTLRLWTTDRAVLYTNDYYAIDTNLPTMGVATPTYGRRITSFNRQIELHDVDAVPATYTVLTLADLDVASNSQAASMSMVLNLTDGDRAAILAMFRANTRPNWRLKVKSGAFTNQWGQPNQLYFPTEPGSVLVATPTFVAPNQARLIACSISDPSPTRDAQPGQLTFEFEIEPAKLGNTYVPMSLTAPTARIASGAVIGGGSNLATGTFQGWSTRTVSGVTRYVARFTNETAFPSTLSQIASTVARLELFGVTDSLGNKLEGANSVATTSVWDLNLKDDLQPLGFTGATATLFIDLQPPVALIPNPAPLLRQADVGMASLTFAFSELMNTAVSANPTMSLATSVNGLPYTIPFHFDSWVSATQARFINDMAITQSLPQGSWTAQLTGFDLADNPLDVATLPIILVQTVGPQLQAWQIVSEQETTASSPGELLINQPFSGNVDPFAATLSIRLAAAPASIPLTLHFLNTSNVTVASFPLTLGGTSGLEATFTWEMASPAGAILPTGTPLVTYGLRLVDAYGNGNIETLSWTRDDTAPSVTLDKIVGGVRGGPANQTYFNPALHSAVTTTWTVQGESLTPLLRVMSNAGTSTDTFQTTVSGTKWNGRWTGRRDDNSTLPDGDYQLDIVDPAGNIAVPLTANPIIATITLDTTAPVVATITSQVNGLARTRFNPNAASIAILLTTGELASPTGVWQIEVRTDAANGTLVATAPVTAPAAGTLQAWWDGRRTNGTLVSEGYYRVYASDLAGNRTSGYLRIYVSTSEFRLISASQIGSATIDLRFDREIDQTWPVASSGFAFSPVGPLVTGLTVGSTSIRLHMVPQPMNGQNTITVTTTNVRSLEGTFLATGKNTITITLDTVGPLLDRVSFEGITTSNQFIAFFNERVTLAGTNPNLSFSLIRGTTPVPLADAAVRDDLTSVLLTSSADLVDTGIYTLIAYGTTDPIGNVSSATTSRVTFTGPDRTAPVFNIAAFSNPANEWDLMVAASSSELLLEPPTLEVTQSGGSMFSMGMTPGSTNLNYMAGVHLDSRYPGNGSLRVIGRDQSGNTGTGTLSFTTALVTASLRAMIESPDQRFSGRFEPGTVRENTLVKIIPQTLETSLEAGQGRMSIVPSIRRILAARRGSVRASTVEGNVVAEASATAQPLPSELIALGQAYEISLKSANLLKPFAINAKLPENTAGSGIGLFRHDDTAGWVWVSAPAAEGWASADTMNPGIYALLRDTQAPRLSVKTQITADQIFKTDRPAFEGTLEEYGSGMADGALVAVVDGIEQPVQIEQTGDGSSRFRFVPLAPLTGGDHDLQFQAADRTGNIARSPAIRFQVQVPLAIGEMMNFPNPARGSRAVIRISANRADIREDLLEIGIYDTAGHRVRWLDGVRPVKEIAGASARYLYDVSWDLRNEDGSVVANGLYLVQVKLRDPDTGRTTKKTHKIAVLR